MKPIIPPRSAVRIATLSLALLLLMVPASAWYDNNYNYRQTFCIDKTNLNRRFIDQPVFVNFTSSNSMANCNDVIFVNITDGNRLDHDLVSCVNDDSQTGSYYVRMEEIDNATDSCAYIYYGYATAPAPLSNPINTYDNGTDATGPIEVFHFNDTGTNIYSTISPLYAEPVLGTAHYRQPSPQGYGVYSPVGVLHELASPLKPNLAEGTIMIYANISNTMVEHRIISENGPTPGTASGVSFGVAGYNAGQFICMFKDTALAWQIVPSSFDDSHGYISPTLLVCTWATNNVHTYINSTLYGSDTSTSTFDVNFSSDMGIGGRDITTNQANITFDELFIWDRPLPIEEIEFYDLSLHNRLIYYSGSAEEKQTSAPTVNLREPTTATKYDTDIDIIFNVTGSNATYTVEARLNETILYSNASMLVNSTISFNIQDNITEGGAYKVLVSATDNGNNAETNATNEFFIFQGVNASVFSANGSALDTFNISSDCSASFTDTNLLGWLSLNDSCTEIMAYVEGAFDNQTESITPGPLMGTVQLNYTLWPIQTFRVTDAKTGAQLSGFNISFAISGSEYANFYEAGQTSRISLRDLQTGLNNISLTKTNYVPYGNATTLTTNSQIYINATLGRAMINILIRDEESDNLIGNFKIAIMNSTNVYLNTTTNESFTFDAEDVPHGEVYIFIEDNNATRGYVARGYYATVEPESNLDITAHMLLSSRGVYYTFYVMESGSTPISEALITAQRLITTSYRTVEQHKTDAGGKATFFLSHYAPPYSMIVSANGYVSINFDNVIDIGNPNTYIVLSQTGEAGAVISNFTTLWDSISYQFLPLEEYAQIGTNFSFQISDSTNALEYFGWNVTRRASVNGTWALNHSQTINDQPAGSTMLLEVVNDSAEFCLDAWFKQAGEPEHNLAQVCKTVYTPQGLSSISFGEVLGDRAYWIVALIITAIIVGFASQFLGLWAGILGITSLAFFVALKPELEVGGVSGWLIVFLTALGFISITFLKSYIPR